MTDWVIVKNRKVIGTLAPNRVLTAAEEADGQSAHMLAASYTGPVYIGGTVTIDSLMVTAITNPNAVSQAVARRNVVKEWLRVAEKLPISNWGQRDPDAATRAANTWWWLEGIAEAARADANLTTQTRWGWISAEMAWPVERWYRLHVAADWSPYGTLVGSRTLRNFYSTATNGSLGSARSSIAMNNPWRKLTDFLV